jgi:hypothetical protein
VGAAEATAGGAFIARVNLRARNAPRRGCWSEGEQRRTPCLQNDQVQDSLGEKDCGVVIEEYCGVDRPGAEKLRDTSVGRRVSRETRTLHRRALGFARQAPPRDVDKKFFRRAAIDSRGVLIR